MECNFKQIPREAEKLAKSLRSELPSDILSDPQRSALWKLLLMYELMISIIDVHVNDRNLDNEVLRLFSDICDRYKSQS